MDKTDTIDDAIALLQGRSFAVLTGAGISTDSGIPDYRGANTVRINPMSIAQYLSSLESRKRYWAGSHLGWQRFRAAEPNAGHRALATLENSGVASGVITQNVDGLHRRAGSGRVIELHGAMNDVLCLTCGQHFARAAIAARLTNANPRLALRKDVVLRPDGDVDADVDADDFADFVVPDCSSCGGMLKPDVVFFGEFVPRRRFHAAIDIVSQADVLLIAGSSLAVNSGIRLLDHAARRDIPVVIINRGATKGDVRAAVRLEGGTTEILTTLAELL